MLGNGQQPKVRQLVNNQGYIIESTIFVLYLGAGRAILSIFILFYAMCPISFMILLWVKRVQVLMPKTAIPYVGWIAKFFNKEGNLICSMHYVNSAR